MKTLKITLLAALCLSLNAADAADQFWKKRQIRKAQETEINLLRDSLTRERSLVDSLEVINLTNLDRQRENQKIAKPDYDNSMTIAYSTQQMDSLLAVWRVRQANDQFEAFQEHYIIDDSTEAGDTTPDSIYVKRLKAMVSPINLAYNSTTKSYISRYINTRYGTINRIMSLSKYYFPMIEQELIINELPVELRAMPIIESALSASAVSRAGAAGLWQFMPATGKSYGLEINTFVDERYDPILATKAAVKFLKDLYNIYDDWTLAIAAYNCGPGNVNKALSRAGLKGESDFWDVYYYLPRETRGYVPAFVGASYAYAYHQQHNIEFEESPIPLATDTIHINKTLHLGQVSEVLDIPMEVLKTLNPQYHRDIIPAVGEKKAYALRLPQRYISTFIEQEEAIHAKDSIYLKEYVDPAKVKKAMTTPPFLYHTVRKGETLGGIASRYRVSIRSIMSLNGIRNANKLRLGQRLKIQTR